MDKKGAALPPHGHPRPRREAWETPELEDVGVSAEVTAYMGVQEFDGT